MTNSREKLVSSLDVRKVQPHVGHTFFSLTERNVTTASLFMLLSFLSGPLGLPTVPEEDMAAYWITALWWCSCICFMPWLNQILQFNSWTSRLWKTHALKIEDTQKKRLKQGKEMGFTSRKAKCKPSLTHYNCKVCVGWFDSHRSPFSCTVHNWGGGCVSCGSCGVSWGGLDHSSSFQRHL